MIKKIIFATTIALAFSNLSWAEDLDIATLEQNAAEGDARSQFKLGEAYEFGKGVEKNPEKAFELYSKAANHGYRAAQTNLGFLYDTGTGTKQDFDAAMNWYKAAANQGDLAAMYNIGLLYEAGRGVKKDIDTAKMWYKKACDLDDQDSCNKLKELQ
ncbi:tetratricopeptide repeat protein [Taylorella equigenitalis]|uniref:Exported protein n=2 Tax=Taylorella equigenitalis TaxID=29575 RepID=A0ABN4AV88_9BURK|nr:tetratricopeptide repeat protein [Taylorella equigenitalis]AFN35762.1 putative exported protein [Taylorella equigenitalis ATCC 35865]ASY30404.1 hypothetical protein B9Z30_03285 [Taylorella equigenitalis]ASY37710.1 sel1 repeat family protein [Taylorella equigenitalis]ASY39177.1 sel1 repeat family protein [Taylorella equigenitalis]ASY40696.1 hypothetical protein CAV20_03210 [Taylorella equigenitalis]